jgi:hypothetical protein
MATAVVDPIPAVTWFMGTCSGQTLSCAVRMPAVVRTVTHFVAAERF